MRGVETVGGLQPKRFRPLSVVALAALMALGGCATQVHSTGTYVTPARYGQQPIARPREVLVDAFTINPDTVQLDSGMKARLEAMSGSSNPQAERQELAYQITSTITETLVDAFNRMGLVARPAALGFAPRPGDVVIQGQIVRVDAGNATRRTLIGFGAGKSEILADVQVLRAGPAGDLRPLQTYNATANSGRTPGLGLGVASAAAGHVALAVAGAAAGTVQRQRSGLAKDAEGLAKKVATNVGDFFAGQGWITPR